MKKNRFKKEKNSVISKKIGNISIAGYLLLGVGICLISLAFDVFFLFTFIRTLF